MVEKEKKTTTIRVSEDTKTELESIGKYGDSMDDIICELLKVYKKSGGKE